MNNRSDELTDIVESLKDDIANDWINDERPVHVAIKTVELQTITAGEDDGTVYGDYKIIVNDGQFVIDITAQAVSGGFEDCWDSSSESHYTRDVTFEDLQDFEYEVTKFTEENGAALDRMVESDVNSREELK